MGHTLIGQRPLLLSNPAATHLRSASNLPGPVQDGPFVRGQVVLPAGLQHAEQVQRPFFLLQLLTLAVRLVSPQLDEKHPSKAGIVTVIHQVKNVVSRRKTHTCDAAV